jgi:aromatic-L-amino-acid/L-tryptophan decarboxylase
VAYASTQTHTSLERAARVLAVTVHRVATDDALRLDVDALRAAVADDRARGRRPWCVVGTAGTTGTAAVDPLVALRRVCDADGMWLHVDGAYGAPAALCPQGRALLEGLDQADSLTLDPHKWLFQTPELGCLLVRDGARCGRRPSRRARPICATRPRATTRSTSPTAGFSSRASSAR